MWSFRTFRDKRYWILLAATLVILVLFVIFIPGDILAKPFFAPVLLLILAAGFWSVYHTWKYFGDKRERKRAENGETR